MSIYISIVISCSGEVVIEYVILQSTDHVECKKGFHKWMNKWIHRNLRAFRLLLIDYECKYSIYKNDLVLNFLLDNGSIPKKMEIFNGICHEGGEEVSHVVRVCFKMYFNNHLDSFPYGQNVFWLGLYYIHTGRHNLRSFLTANSAQNYFLIARMLSFLWHSRQKSRI